MYFQSSGFVHNMHTILEHNSSYVFVGPGGGGKRCKVNVERAVSMISEVER